MHLSLNFFTSHQSTKPVWRGISIRRFFLLVLVFVVYLSGDINPEDLSDEELNYLTPYVTEMLLRLQAADDTDQSQDDPEAWKKEAMEKDMLLGTFSRICFQVNVCICAGKVGFCLK